MGRSFYFAKLAVAAPTALVVMDGVSFLRRGLVHIRLDVAKNKGVCHVTLLADKPQFGDRKKTQRCERCRCASPSTSRNLSRLAELSVTA
ncbi:hypothetical protein Tco_0122582 [Tanacetum coccineum]